MNRLRFGLITAVIAAMATSANAAVILTLDAGGGNSVSITDGAVNDSNGTIGVSNGVVTWIGTLGVWNINVSTGVSTSGTPTLPTLDLNSINRSTGAGTLTITLTDTGFLGGASNALLGAIGGTTDGTVTAQSWINPSNVSGAQTGPAANPGTFTTPSFNGSNTSTTAILNGAFSITEKVVITHTAAGLTSFDFNAHTTVPEPTTLWSAALGLGLCAMYARRRKA